MLCLLHLRTLVYHTCLYAVQPVSVSDLVKRRMEASQKLQVNPADPEAKGTLHSIDQQVHVCRAIYMIVVHGFWPESFPPKRIP